MRFDVHCKALGRKIMIPGRLAWEKVTQSGHRSRFVVDVMGGDLFRLGSAIRLQNWNNHTHTHTHSGTQPLL